MIHDFSVFNHETDESHEKMLGEYGRESRQAHTRQSKSYCTQKGGAQLSEQAKTAMGCRGNPTN